MNKTECASSVPIKWPGRHLCDMKYMFKSSSIRTDYISRKEISFAWGSLKVLKLSKLTDIIWIKKYFPYRVLSLINTRCWRADCEISKFKTAKTECNCPTTPCVKKRSDKCKETWTDTVKVKQGIWDIFLRTRTIFQWTSTEVNVYIRRHQS